MNQLLLQEFEGLGITSTEQANNHQEGQIQTLQNEDQEEVQTLQEQFTNFATRRMY